MSIDTPVTTIAHEQNEISRELNFTQLTTRYDPELSTIWCWMHPTPRPCVNVRLLDEVALLQTRLTTTYNNQASDTVWPFRHLILASKIPGIYNLGGDLELFKHCINNNDKELLKNYAHKCINLLHQNINNLELPITLVALIQGQALGGGLETALSCDVIIAERGSQMGFPEILFNLFPGMGAYNMLARRTGPSLAERIILSGRTYSAEEFYDMGIVDVLADAGDGEKAVEKYLSSQNQSHNTIQAMKKIRQIVHPITHESLTEIVDIWVDAALAMSKQDMARLERLLFLQKGLKSQPSHLIKPADKISRRGDWRKTDEIEFPLVTHLGENIPRNRRKGARRKKNIKESINAEDISEA
jgi:DSF synthase